MENINLTDEVMKTIQDKDVQMKPKIYFIAGTVLLATGIFTLFLISILFANFSWQQLRVVSPFGYLSFGSNGLLVFLRTFPWIPLLISIAASMSGILFLKSYDFSYKHNFLIISLSILTAVFVSGVIIDESGLNEQLEKIPPIRQFMRHDFQNELWVVGEITQIEDPILPLNEKKLYILTPEGTQIIVVINQDTRFPHGSNFSVQDKVRVIGEWKDDCFYAHGINKGNMRWRKMSVLPHQSQRIIITF